jgi:hypothetical protein
LFFLLLIDETVGSYAFHRSNGLGGFMGRLGWFVGKDIERGLNWVLGNVDFSTGSSAGRRFTAKTVFCRDVWRWLTD